jgi:sirohydrochlorin cobaltochelatase
MLLWAKSTNPLRFRKGAALKTIILLAMHGAPPNDLPRDEMAEYFGLRAQLGRVSGPERAALERRHEQLDAKVRNWPRTAQNDPFHSAAHNLALHLSRAAGTEVVVGFNEFCAPTLDDALDQAVAVGAEKVIVVTPMMTRGGEHAEADIPEALGRARERHPAVSVDYVWPFDVSEVAQFLADQLHRRQ